LVIVLEASPTLFQVLCQMSLCVLEKSRIACELLGRPSG
jgi:hypothetical protein